MQGRFSLGREKHVRNLPFVEVKGNAVGAEVLELGVNVENVHL